MGLIRTQTFIKYSRINLQEAQRALQNQEYDKCLIKVLYCTDALIKAIAAALPMVNKDFFSMKSSELLRHVSDLAPDEETAGQIVSRFLEARELSKTGKPREDTSRQALTAAGQAFDLLQGLFPKGP